MSAPTGNFRGSRTQSSTSGYKTIGSSIASGNNSGSFKRIFFSALGSTNGNYDLAFTKTLGIPKNYYNSSSNSHYYQHPSLSGKTRNVVTDLNAKTLTQVSQSATVGFALPPPPPSCSAGTALSDFTINNGYTSIMGSISEAGNGLYEIWFGAPIKYYITSNLGSGVYGTINLSPGQSLSSNQVGNYFTAQSTSCNGNIEYEYQISLTITNTPQNNNNFITIQGSISPNP